MFGIADYGAFCAAILLFLALPGPGTFACSPPRARAGLRAGAAATAGVILGDQVLLWLAVAGVAAVLAAHPALVQGGAIPGRGLSGVDRACGCCWRAAGAASPVRIEPHHYLRQALFITLLNPKAIVFYMAFFPLFIDPATHRGLPTFAAMALTIAYHRGLLPDAVRLRAGRVSDRYVPTAIWRWRLQRLAGVFLVGFRSAPGARLKPAVTQHLHSGNDHGARVLCGQPEGWGRQDHHHGEPGRRVGAGGPAGADGRPRPAGQCHHGLGHRQARPGAVGVRRAARIGQRGRGAGALGKGRLRPAWRQPRTGRRRGRAGPAGASRAAAACRAAGGGPTTTTSC